MYSCKQCGAEVLREGTRRTCEHTGTIIADMKATAYGEGHMDTAPSRLSQIVAAIISLVKPA